MRMGDLAEEVVAFLFLLNCICSNVQCAMPFRNTSLPWHERVEDLVGRLTLEEVRDQLSHGGAGKNGPAPPIPRLDIGPYSWNTECLRGDAEAGYATSFPQALGLAASFSKDIMSNVSLATSLEARAKYNDYQKHKLYGDHRGLSCFSPVVNIMRHPYWGRNQETYGEDPYLTGKTAQAFISGLQGDGRYIRANAGCKHLAVYDGPDSYPVARFVFNAVVSERDLRTTYLPAFRTCVKSGVYSVGGSYNLINGIPSAANKYLMTDVMRKQFNFTGYYFSDEGAIEFMMTKQHYTKNLVDTAAASLNAGINLDLALMVSNITAYTYMLEAIKQSKVTEKTIRDLLKPLIYTRMRLGEFDPPEMNPYTKINMSIVQGPEHQALSLKAAQKSYVLLKNNGLLPLKSKKYKTIAIVGPMADNYKNLYGDYSPTPIKNLTVTPLKGLFHLGETVQYTAGCIDGNPCTKYNSSEIKDTVVGAEIIFVCLGTGQRLEAEGNDRKSFHLPENQMQLLSDVTTYAKGASIVLLLFTAGPPYMTKAYESKEISAIINCFFSAQMTGEALRKVLLNEGPDANPAARLPFTWPADESQIAPITNCSMEGKTYRYFTGDPLFAFGYGLSYTKFQYVSMSLTANITAGNDQIVSGKVQNVGSYDGDEVIQVYIVWQQVTLPKPRIQLVGYDRVFIPKGGSHIFEFTVEARDMVVWDDKDGFVIFPGSVQVFVGGQLPGQKRSVGSNILNRTFHIHGKKVIGWN